MRPRAAAPGPGGAHRQGHGGVWALAVLAPIWGYGWVVSKLALEYSAPLTFAAIYLPLSAGCLFLVLAVTRRSLRPPPLAYTAVIGLLQTTMFVGLAIVSLAGGGAGEVSVLSYTMPFWLLVLARGFLGERVRGLQWLAVGLAFAGLVVVVEPWRAGGALSGILACAGGLAWAASALAVKLMQRRHDVDVLALTAWQLALGAIPIVAVAAFTHSGGPEWTAGFSAALAYTVLLANAVAWVLWFFSLRALRAGAAGLGTLAVPVIGVLAAWLQLGERPTALAGAGMALIVAALAILAVGGLRATERDAAALHSVVETTANEETAARGAGESGDQGKKACATPSCGSKPQAQSLEQRPCSGR